MKYIEIVEVLVSSKPGVPVGEALKEGLEIAVKEWRNVAVRHNGNTHKILVNDLMASISQKKN